MEREEIPFFWEETQPWLNMHRLCPELMESLGGNTYYSVLDMWKGYHQEGDKPLSAFRVGPLGFYEYNRLLFGLSNAPATY